MILTEMDIDLNKLNEEINALQKFLNTLPEKAINLGIRVLIAVALFFVGSKLIKLIRRIVKRSFERAGVEIGIVQFLDGFIKVCLYIFLVLLIAGNFGFDAASVVALLGSAGVTVGLALQGSLSNLAGGVLILLLKPFRVGDYIIESGQGTEGTVTEIGIFYTKLSTIDGKVVVLPNGNLANNSITNATDSPLRRVDLTVGISYDSDIKMAKEVLQNVMDSDEEVLHGEPSNVFVDSLAESAVVIGTRCFCENPKYWEVRWRLIENMKLALDDAGIEIPFTQISLHMDNEEKNKSFQGDLNP